MIQSASSSPSAGRADALATGLSGNGARPTASPTDQIHIDKAATLRASLQQVPEIRPEVVARAQALAADPSYPSDQIIRHVSAAIVNSPDLSEDQS